MVAPPPALEVDSWADTYRKLSPESSAEPGQWNTARAEYQRGIFKAVSDSAVHTVVVMSSAQVGKTEIINNTVGYYVHQDPSPIMLVQPTLEMAQAWSKDRLAPMLRDTKELAGLVSDVGARKAGNTMLHKVFPGGHITMSGANSPASLASRPIRVLLCDEVDRYPPSAGTEGDPVSLARKRTRTFWNRKIVITSTPTVKGASRVELEFEQSDQRHFYIPCPDCGHFQTLKWSHVQWPEGEPDKAQYCCEECSVLFGDSKRLAAIQKGEWRATQPFNGRAGFHLNEIYSPWSTMPDMANAFLEAKKSPETLKTFINTALGESWEEAGETIDNTGLLSRRVKYPAPVPAGGLVLTMGVDVQGDRLEYEVVAWGHGEQTWGIENGVLPGDPAMPLVWADLDNLLEKTWRHEDGTDLRIASTGIDSGGNHTQIVYDYCRNRANRRVFALKGVAGAGRPVVQISRKARGRAVRKVDLYNVGVDDAKGIIYARLRVTEPGPSYCHFPDHYQEEYFLQLTAEKMVTKFRKGFPHKEWIKTRPRNEALDNRVYAFAALKILNPVWAAIERRMKKAQNIQEPDGEEAELAKKAAPKSKRRPRKSGGYMNRWK